MKYRVRCDLILDVEDETVAKEIAKTLHKLRDFFRIIRLGELAEERSFIVLEKCYHDEEPSKPCEIVFRWVKEG